MVRPPMIVTHEGGKKFAIQVRDHRLLVDQPVSAGGEDAAPMPLELLGSAVGSCVALYVQQFCEARGLAYEGMQVEVRQYGAKDPGRIGRFEVRVKLPEALPERYVAVVERVARSCPAHHTLALGAEVDIAVEQPSGVG